MMYLNSVYFSYEHYEIRLKDNLRNKWSGKFKKRALTLSESTRFK